MRKYIDIISESNHCSTKFDDIEGDLFESDSRSPIEDIIARAGFSVDDCDHINHGECGSFAVALFEVLRERHIPARIGLIARSHSEDPTRFGDQHSLYWGHMFIESQGRYFDAEGEVLMEHMISNYLGGFVEAGYEVKAFYFDSLDELFRHVRPQDVINSAVKPRLQARISEGKWYEE